jgi:hypothetical protein
MVVAEHFNTHEKKNTENAFKEAIALYFKSLVGLKYIGNRVIHQIQEQKKPTMMPYNDFERHHCQLLLYVTQNNLLHRTLIVPTPQELVEQLFLVQPKAHQAKYAKISEDVEQDANKLCTFFEGCRVDDVTDCTFHKLKTSIATNCKAKKDKDERVSHSDISDGGNLILLETAAINVVIASMIAISTMIAMIVAIKTLITTMMIIETMVTRTTMTKKHREHMDRGHDRHHCSDGKRTNDRHAMHADRSKSHS